MPLPEILSSTLGLSEPWRVTNVSFSVDRKRLDITVSYDHNGGGSCPKCDQPDSSEATETKTIWFHESFLNYQTYLHSETPRTSCCKSILDISPPWSRDGSRFVRLQETMT